MKFLNIYWVSYFGAQSETKFHFFKCFNVILLMLFFLGGGLELNWCVLENLHHLSKTIENILIDLNLTKINEWVEKKLLLVCCDPNSQQVVWWTADGRPYYVLCSVFPSFDNAVLLLRFSITHYLITFMFYQTTINKLRT